MTAAGRHVLFDSTQIRRALGLRVGGGLPGEEVRNYTGVSTDSRTLEPGDLFVALAGARQDGADFLDEVARRGALGAVVAPGRETEELELEWFPASDPLWALGELAAWYRGRSAARVVGVTGSSGKTTVKEMVAAALQGAYGVHRTAGNLNSRVGLPLTIFQAPPEATVWVLELGASLPGEIARLTRIAAPDDAIVTTAGAAHLEAFDDEEAVLREKLSLVEGSKSGGVVVVGDRPPALVREARRLRRDTIVAGLDAQADVRPDRYGVEAQRVWFERAGVRFQLAVGGEHHLRDALIAAALAEALEVSLEDIALGLEAFRPLGMRSSLRQVGRLTVLADCYNANPESFAAAIDYLATVFPGRRLVAVVGTMLEMGEHEERAHREVLEQLLEADVDLVVATGAFESAVRGLVGSRNGTRFLLARDPETVWDELAAALEGDEVVLVKGSRGVRLERIVRRLEARFGEARA